MPRYLVTDCPECGKKFAVARLYAEVLTVHPLTFAHITCPRCKKEYEELACELKVLVTSRILLPPEK
jgi:hypothetical protein